MTAQGKRSKQALKIKKTANWASKQGNSQIEPNKAADQSGKQANSPIRRPVKQEPKPNQTKTARNIKVKENIFVVVVVVEYHENYNNSSNRGRG